jgi:hypothetical protein
LRSLARCGFWRSQAQARSLHEGSLVGEERSLVDGYATDEQTAFARIASGLDWQGFIVVTSDVALRTQR